MVGQTRMKTEEKVAHPDIHFYVFGMMRDSGMMRRIIRASFVGDFIMRNIISSYVTGGASYFTPAGQARVILIVLAASSSKPSQHALLLLFALQFD